MLEQVREPCSPYLLITRADVIPRVDGNDGRRMILVQNYLETVREVERKLLGSHCPKCNYRYATPRSHCMYCGSKTDWFELPAVGRVHSWTVCYFAAQEFLKDVPFTLALVEFDGVDTLFLSRLIGVERADIKIGMKVKPKFRRKATWSVRDVYFVKAQESL